MKPLDLLLINAPSRLGAYGHLAPLAAVEPPVWCGLIARYALNHGFTVQILDAEAEGLDAERTANCVLDASPRLAVFCIYGHQPSASTQCLPGAGAVARVLQGKVPTLALGTHPSALPERTLREGPFDYVCQGEGPYQVGALLKQNIFQMGNKIIRGSLTPESIGVSWSMPGIWHYGHSPSHATKNITDLDIELPGQAWELLDMTKYKMHNMHAWTAQKQLEVKIDNFIGTPTGTSRITGGYASVQTSLNCVFSCSFCCIAAPFGDRKMRFWSPENVINQITTLVRDYGITNIKIPDEMFVLNRDHVRAICKGLISRGLGDRLNLWAYARVDTVKDDALLNTMRRAGFRWLGIGIESGSKHVRDGMAKGKFDDEDIVDAITRVQGHGIHVGANYIFGLPDDTHESMQATLDLAVELNTEWANFYCLPTGSLIYTPNGVKTIETIQENEEVLGWGGRATVISPMSRYYDGELFTIKPRYLPPVKLTEEHPILVTSITRAHDNSVQIGTPHWAKPNEISPYTQHTTPYDAVVISKRGLTKQKTFVDFSSFIKWPTNISSKRKTTLNARVTQFLKPRPLTEDLAELFGWYVAEGARHSKKNKTLGFGLGANEPENVRRVCELIMKCFGFKSKVSAVKNVRNIHVVSGPLFRALPEFFGTESCKKRLPQFIMDSTVGCTRAFLKGYVAGDGTSHPNANGQFSAGTCSKTLAYQLLLLFLKVNVVPGWVETYPTSPGKFTKSWTKNTMYGLYWTVTSPTHYFQDENNFYIPISKVTSKKYAGQVFNIETSNHTYGVPFIVHNCAMAYPGSPLYKIAGERGWARPDDPGGPGWLGYSQHAYESLPLPTETLTYQEVLDFRDAAHMHYFSRPEYQAMLFEKFGQRAVDNITQMLTLGKPKRKHRDPN